MTKPIPLSKTKAHPASQRITGILFASQALFSIGTINAFTVTSIIAAALSGSDSAAGLPSTMTAVGRAVMAYPMGWLLDKVGRRLGLSVSYVLGMVGAIISLLSVIAGSFTGFLFGAFLIGGLRSGAEQGRFVAAEVQPMAQRARAIGIIVFAGTIGSILGPRLVKPASDLALRFSIPETAGPFGVAALATLLAAILIFIFLRPDPLKIGKIVAAGDVVVGDAPADTATIRPLREIYGNSVIRLAVMSMVLGQLVMAMLMVITPLYMDHNGHDLDTVSWVIMAHTLGMFGLSGVTGWLIDRVGRFPIIATGASILIIAAIVMPLSPNFYPLAAALFLLGLGWNFCFIAGSSLLSDQLAAQERGRAQGVNETMVALGASAGSLLSGVLFDAGGVLFTGGLGLILAGILLATTLYVGFRTQKNSV